MVRASASLGNRQGFADYNDAATAITPITLPAGVWTELTNDGLGPNTNLQFIPPGVTELMDLPSGHIHVGELDLGDSIVIRNDYTVTTSAANTCVMFRYMLGTGPAAYTLENLVGTLPMPTTQQFTLTANFIYMGDTNTKDNPIIPQLMLDKAGSVVNAGTVIEVVKRT